jgi:hypothetical protein
MIRSIGQAHARLGSPDPRKYIYGGLYLSIQLQIKAYTKFDAPPLRVKPIPILVIMYII